MFLFLDQLANDVVNTFITDFGEDIVYVPFGAPPIKMKAIINRHPASAIPGLQGGNVYKHEIQIANHPIYGRTVVNKGKDTVILNNKIGGAVETFAVLQIIMSDEGLWLLGVG